MGIAGGGVDLCRGRWLSAVGVVTESVTDSGLRDKREQITALSIVAGATGAAPPCYSAHDSPGSPACDDDADQPRLCASPIVTVTPSDGPNPTLAKLVEYE